MRQMRLNRIVRSKSQKLGEQCMSSSELSLVQETQNEGLYGRPHWSKLPDGIISLTFSDCL